MTTGLSAVLVIQSDVVGGSLFPLRTADRCVIGRSSTCDIVIDLTLISRRHAEIVYHDQRFFASDLGSSNGTLLNGEPLLPGNERALSYGDLLSFAEDQVSILFQETSDAAIIGGATPAGRDVSSDDTATTSSARIAVHTALSIDLDSRQLRIDEGQILHHLSSGEFDLLAVLYERRGTAVAYEELVAALYPESMNPDAAIEEIDMSIRQLRTRLELIPTNPRLIVTLPAYGYILVGPPV
jgi:DNA-binding winged helix-turn-helix (wHTH) protein